ncbi:formate dehydrogenase subunit gamma [Hydrogenophaga sp. BPS33]|uniref:formate dehydrogenase subunit gamma n=1 Tax=Hydrogenophaga sp. BPS33 TaxID=2651974 RepID=UPI0013203834|nr:formate dehydrogenase subunit gamma [Hydrogenophaga sp. BPS33]QHE88781.1 formate dehydrogenase subunit gamma [Hydrogenophaga sp. BPS33]
MKRCLFLWLLAAWVGIASAQVQTPAPAAADAAKGPPAGFVAPPEPQPDENNAARARSQPGNNAPFWRGVRESGEAAGVTNLPGVEKGVLIQRFVRYPGSEFTTAGEAWRQVRNRVIIPYGGSLMLIVLVAIAIFYFTKGAIGHDHAQGGRRIERFTPFERAAHWLNAIAFVLLAISGIVMAFGKFFLLPVLGSTLFGMLTYGLKTLHNFVGPLFAVSLVVIIVTFIKDNLPRKGDWAWIKKGGGMLSGQEVPSHRFNAGEKAIFWGGVFVLGLTVVASGVVLDQLLPNLDYTRGTMQVAHLFHAIGAVLMMCAFFGHIYLGTIGMRGAYKAMRTGYVDEGWAREHHALWYADIQAGKIPAQRSGTAAPKEPAPRPREA